MIKITITDDNENSSTYSLKSYDIKIEKDSVIIKVEMLEMNKIFTYELRPDERFQSVEDIAKYLKKTIEEVQDTGSTLKISEGLIRMYITIGYELDGKLECAQFTASKIH